MDGGIDNKHQNTETKRLAGNSMSDFLWIKIMEPVKVPRKSSPRE